MYLFVGLNFMNRSKVVAVITGAIAILISLIYLVIVQLLDFRGDMVPAPMDLSVKLPFDQSVSVVQGKTGFVSENKVFTDKINPQCRIEAV